MKKCALILMIIICCSLFAIDASAQCSVCSRSAQQMGEEPAKGLNAGILYLAFAPFAIGGYIYYRWRKSEKGL